MTYDELLTHQYSNGLEDEWFVAVSGHPSPSTKTLLEIKALKDNAPDLEIHVLHASEVEHSPPQWFLLESRDELLQKSIPQRATFHIQYNKFSATLDQMQILAQQAIQQLGYTVTSVGYGFVGFETGMTWGSWSGVTGSVSITEHEPYWFTVQGSGKQNVRGLQLAALDFGEATGKAAKVVKVMKQIASS